MPATPLSFGNAAPNSGTYYSSGGGGGGGGFLHALFHNPVTHIADKTLEGLAKDVINSPAGFVQLGEGLYNDPIHTLEAFGKGLYQPFLHPLRAPDQTLLSALALLPIPGMAVGRAADIASIVGREGALPAELATDTATIGEKTALQYAESLGKGDQYQRIIGADNLPRSVGSQVRHTLLHGPAYEERLIPTATGEMRRGAQYAKDPTIRAAQKMIDQTYNHFGGKIPIWLRVVPGFQRSQAARLNSAAKAAQTIERMSVKKNAASFLKKWSGKLTPEEETAVRLVGEMRNPDGSINLHEAELRAGREDVNVPETQNQIRLIKSMQEKGLVKLKPVTLASGKKYSIPVLSDTAPSYLHEYLHDARGISNEQQAALANTGNLSDESLLNRLMLPFHQVEYGGRLPPSIEKLQFRLNQLRGLKGTEEARAKVEAKLKFQQDQWAPKEADPNAPVSPEAQIQAHTDRLRSEPTLGPNMEEVPHDMTVAEMRELRDVANPFYIPYKIHKEKQGFASTAFVKSFKFRGKPTTLSRLTHAAGSHVIDDSERTLLKQGGGRQTGIGGESDVLTKLIAENYTEGIRYVTLMNHYKHILATAQDTPEGIPEGHATLIRDVTNLKERMPFEKAEQYTKIKKDLDEGRILDDQAGALQYEGIRNWLFPDKEAVFGRLNALGHQVKEMFTEDEAGKFRPVPGYKWVDDRTLGYLNKKNPLWSAFESPRVRGVIRTADAINTAQKDAVLYLKPAYAAPNAFGNLFLNAVQQGAWAPINLARSVRLLSRLKPEVVEKIRQTMGGGYSEQLQSPGVGGLIHRGSNALARGYGKFVDDPFRFASFLHEARVAGFSKNADLERLFGDPALSGTIDRIASRANEEILNYERMGPGEEAILRRLVFFYPWLKASTRYASYMAKNHPFAAGSVGTLGQMGSDRIERVLGDLPSFLEGLIPVTGAHGPPWARTALTINPSSSAVIQEPADLLKTLLNTVHGHPNLDLSAFSNLAPVDRAALSFLTSGKISTLPHSVNDPVLKTVWNELTGGNPLIGGPSSFIERMTGGPTYPGSVYPYNDKHTALLRFLLTGALTPTLTNVSQTQWDAYKQANTTGFVGG